MKGQLRLVVFFILFIAALSHEYKCIHDDIAPTNPTIAVQKYFPTKERRSVDKRFRNGFSAIRITFDTSNLQSPNDQANTCFQSGQIVATSSGTYTCKDEDVLSPAKADFIRNTLLVNAQALLNESFAVVPVSNNLILPNVSCFASGNDLLFPTSYVTTGLPNTDLLIMVTGRPILTAGVLAFAAECASDQNERPIAGFINFGPSSLNTTDVNLVNSQIRTALHEITHILGYNFNKFSRFRENDGVTLRTNVVIDDAGVKKLALPSLISFMKTQFNCPTVTGGDLENGGGAGTALSHWEKRIFLQEYMIATSSRYPVFSNFTLNAFADSGWYDISFGKAEVMEWGLGQGCDFLDATKCSATTGWKQEGTACKALDQQTCTFDRLAVGACVANDPFMDGCAYINAFSNLQCVETNTQRPVNPLITNTYDTGEVFGASSRCFSSSLAKSLPTPGLTQDLCYQTICAGPDRLKLIFNNFHYSCAPGLVLQVDGFGGSLTCPVDNLLCAGTLDDPAWPEFVSVDPTTARPDNNITINGQGFSNTTVVTLQTVVLQCSLVSDRQLICKLPPADSFTSLKSILQQKLTLFISNLDSNKTAVGVKVVKVELTTGEIANNIIQWFKDNPVYTALIFGGLFVVLIIGGCIAFINYRRMERERRRAQII